MDNTAADRTAEDEVLQYISFQLAGETYGINVMQVREVLRYTEIAPVPGAPHYVLGIINLRGNVVTVVDARCRFGLPQGETSENSRIVIIEADSRVVGLLVDSVAEVVYVKRSEIESTPKVGSDETANYIHGVCNRDDELLILIDLDKILSKDEWGELDGFAA
jgi:purine-binding chemotaxis protein CheW